MYGAGVALKNQAYDRGWLRQARLPCPVISVGNLSLGGTGKTACVEYLAAKLTRQGLRVCVLSRGYGARSTSPYWLVERQGRLLVNGEPAASPDGLADEPQLLARHVSGVPVVVGSRREQTGLMAYEELHAEVVLLDDGFQHRQVFRNLDIVLVNARMPLSGEHLFPRGPMREPLESLVRAHVIIVTKADQSLDMVAALQEQLKRFAPQALIAMAIHEPEGLRDWHTDEAVPLERVNGHRIALLSSIGDPEGFEQTVKQLGASVVSHAAYPDHHRYQPSEWDEVVRTAHASRADALVTTEKDLIRLAGFNDEGSGPSVPVWVLKIRMRMLSGEPALDDRLAGVCAR